MIRMMLKFILIWLSHEDAKFDSKKTTQDDHVNHIWLYNICSAIVCHFADKFDAFSIKSISVYRRLYIYVCSTISIHVANIHIYQVCLWTFFHPISTLWLRPSHLFRARASSRAEMPSSALLIGSGWYENNKKSTQLKMDFREKYINLLTIEGDTNSPNAW